MSCEDSKYFSLLGLSSTPGPVCGWQQMCLRCCQRGWRWTAVRWARVSCAASKNIYSAGLPELWGEMEGWEGWCHCSLNWWSLEGMEELRVTQGSRLCGCKAYTSSLSQHWGCRRTIPYAGEMIKKVLVFFWLMYPKSCFKCTCSQTLGH